MPVETRFRSTRRTSTRPPAALVLHYHRVVEAERDPNRLCVSPQHFSQQLAFLRSHATPLALSELQPALARRDGPVRPVAVTLDDGYADNLHNAKPLLEYHCVPATVFVATGYLNAPNGFWWDELESLLSQPEPLAKSVQVTIRRKPQRFGSTTPVWTYAARLLGRRFLPSKTVYHRLRARLLTLSNAERSEVLAELRAQLGAPPPSDGCRALSDTELRELAYGGLVEIGAHTVTHPVLSQLTPRDQIHEIHQSKDHLERILKQAVTKFAYPYGSSSSYTAETIAAVGEAGFDIACTTRTRPVYCDTDPLELPRVSVGDWCGEELARRLRRMNW